MSITLFTCDTDINSTCLYVGLLPLSAPPLGGWRLIVLTSLLSVFPLDRRLQIYRQINLHLLVGNNKINKKKRKLKGGFSLPR